MKKIIRSYKERLKRISLVWKNTFWSHPPIDYYGKVYFLICHKIFWAYFRQGLWEEEFHISFPPRPTTREVTPSFAGFYCKRPLVYFQHDKQVEEILEEVDLNY